jgi:hypothetical protein
MIAPEPPPSTFSPPETMLSDQDCERLGRALRDLSEDQGGFMKRLNYAIEDIFRKK